MGQIRTSTRLWNLKHYMERGDKYLEEAKGINTFVRGPRPVIGDYRPPKAYISAEERPSSKAD